MILGRCPPRKAADLPCRFRAIHPGHPEIHENAVRLPGRRQFDRPGAVGGLLHLETHGAEQGDQQAAAVLDVVDDEDARGDLSGAEAGAHTGAQRRGKATGLGRPPQRHVDPERAAPPERALHGDVAAHEARQFAADGEPEPRAGAGVAAEFGLFELAEEARQLGRGDPRAGVLHGGMEVPAAIRRGGQFRPQEDAPARGELHRVAEEVDEDLPEPGFVSHRVVGKYRWRGYAELEPLGLGPLGEHQAQVGEEVPQGEGRRPEGDAPRLDLGHVEDVIDEGEQVIAVAIDDGQVIALGGRQVRISQ